MSALAGPLLLGGMAISGIGNYSASRANARAMDAQAIEELNAGAAQEADLRVQARAAIGEQVAAQFSNGFQGGTGSALDTLRESQINAALDVLRIRREASVKATTLRTQAKATRKQAVFSAAGTLLGMGAAGISMRNDWAAARSGSTSSVDSGAYGGGIVGDGDGSNMSGGISRVRAY